MLFFNHSSFQTISKQFFHHLSQEINKFHIHSLNEISTKSFCNLRSDNSRGINRLIELNIHQVNRDFLIVHPRTTNVSPRKFTNDFIPTHDLFQEEHQL